MNETGRFRCTVSDHELLRRWRWYLRCCILGTEFADEGKVASEKTAPSRALHTA